MDLSRSADIGQIGQVFRKKMTGTRILVKKSSSDYLKDFEYKRYSNTKLCMVFMWMNTSREQNIQQNSKTEFY